MKGSDLYYGTDLDYKSGNWIEIPDESKRHGILLCRAYSTNADQGRPTTKNIGEERWFLRPVGSQAIELHVLNPGSVHTL